MPNAAVLPEPVRDWTIRSRPSRDQRQASPPGPASGRRSPSPRWRAARRRAGPARRRSGPWVCRRRRRPGARRIGGRGGRRRRLRPRPRSAARSGRVDAGSDVWSLNGSVMVVWLRKRARRWWCRCVGPPISIARASGPGVAPGVVRKRCSSLRVGGFGVLELVVDHAQLFPALGERTLAAARRSGSARRRPSTVRARTTRSPTSAGPRRCRSGRAGCESSPGGARAPARRRATSSRQPCRSAGDAGEPTGAPSGTALRRR